VRIHTYPRRILSRGSAEGRRRQSGYRSSSQRIRQSPRDIPHKRWQTKPSRRTRTSESEDLFLGRINSFAYLKQSVRRDHNAQRYPVRQSQLWVVRRRSCVILGPQLEFFLGRVCIGAGLCGSNGQTGSGGRRSTGVEDTP